MYCIDKTFLIFDKKNMKKDIKILFFSLLLASACSENKKDTTTTVETIIDSVKTTITTPSYKLQSGNLSLEVDPKTGARISSIKINGEEILYGKLDSSNNWGSTFWPSPQELWGWPPIPVLDNESYRDTAASQGFSLVSNIAAKPKISVLKNFVASPEDSSFIINYTITNQSDSAIKIAPWEITRVPAGGIFFYPKGKDKPKGDLKVFVKNINNITWYDYDSATIPKGVPKLFADGEEGWLAYLSNERNLLVKKFENAPLENKAPDPENEIELYTDSEKRYTEVEQQGAYKTLEPKNSYTWTVKWYARKVPASVNAAAGSKDLAAFVRTTLN